MWHILKERDHDKEGHISSFQALMLSVAGRVGGGNIAGVAVAITLGGSWSCVLDVGHCAYWHGNKLF